MTKNFETNDEPIQPPMVVGNSGSLSWDETADVIVVGFGGAGVSAAIQARDAGAEVIALDRFAGGGAR